MAYTLLAPLLAFVAVFLVYPLLVTVYLAFTKYNFVYDAAPAFAGLRTLADTLGSADFRASILTTAKFTAMFLPAFVAGGLVIALLVDHLPRFGSVFQAVLFSPLIVGASVSGVMFTWILGGDYGLLNQALQNAHLAFLRRDWLTDAALALPAVALVTLWKQIGIAMLVFLAGLRAIPHDLYDAAHVDGAGPWHTFWTVTAPGLAAYTAIVVVWGLVQAVKVFDVPYAMTKGGPGTTTTTMYFQVWNDAFKYFDLATAAASGCLIAVVILIGSGAALRAGRSSAA